MFDSIGAFANQFIPVEGGYIYYPSKKDGGKFVTADEYERLLEGWRKVAGRRGTWTIAGIAMLAIILWTGISRLLSLSDWSDSIIIAALVIAISAWLIWISFAPRRLVRNRPAIVPPRSNAESKRQVRAMLNWRLIIFVLLITGMILLVSLNSPKQSFESRAWLIGSGTMFSFYAWIAIQKFRDR